MSGFTQYATPANAAEKVSNTNSKKLSSEHRLRSSGTEIFSCLTNLVALSADVPQSQSQTIECPKGYNVQETWFEIEGAGQMHDNKSERYSFLKDYHYIKLGTTNPPSDSSNELSTINVEYKVVNSQRPPDAPTAIGIRIFALLKKRGTYSERLISSFQVPANNPSWVVSDAVLEAGKRYAVRVSGTWSLASAIFTRWADEFGYSDEEAKKYFSEDGLYRRTSPVNPLGALTYIKDSNSSDESVVRSGMVLRPTQPEKLSFHINDWNGAYGDNLSGANVEIWEQF
jgi:hypothetical protein